MSDDKARKAAEEWVRKESANLDINNQCITDEDVENLPIEDRHIYWAAVRGVLQGVAWARANPEWIRKSERPPEFGERMLVAYGSGDFTYLECCEGRNHDDGTCEVVYRDEFYDLNDDEFTHYMLVAALPPAPEGE